ncbi:recombinase family protein [Sorangium sp. So ce302]|uniref:recombinase family protein n=1 Tax=Sorangium sp. So ce302 TaxID=3133297 RepID=UPI003F609E25
MRKRAAMYLRVSKGEQKTANQRSDLTRQARTRGLHIVAEYEEQASTAKERSKFDAMMRAAHEGKFDVLLIWAIERFGRSMVGNLQAVLDLDRRGVEVVSVREPWLNSPRTLVSRARVLGVQAIVRRPRLEGRGAASLADSRIRVDARAVPRSPPRRTPLEPPLSTDRQPRFSLA